MSDTVTATMARRIEARANPSRRTKADAQRARGATSHPPSGGAGRLRGTARHSQRSIARALGMSVGLTNPILKRLAQKGLVMMRRVNHNNVHYLVTPAGVEEVSRRSYLYLRRTVGHAFLARANR